MGGLNDQQGKGSHLPQHDDTGFREKPRVEPGKSTQVPATKPQIDDTYVKDGSEHAGTGEDVFTPAQRGRLINAFQQRTLAADSAFKTALTQVRVDKLIEQPEDMSWVLNLALMAVGAWGALTLEKITTQILAQQAAALTKYLEGDTGPRMTKLAAGLYEKIQAVGPDLAKKSQDGSKVISAGITAARGWESKIKNKADVDFLDLLGAQTALLFQRIRETGMLKKTDAELLLLHESWDAQYNSTGDYKLQILEMIEKYKKSEIKGVGSFRHNPFNDSRDPGFARQAPGGAHNGVETVNRFVTRLVFQSGATVRYAISDKYSPASTGYPSPQVKGKAPDPVKYTFEKYSLIKLIDPDLEQVAVVRHRQEWGTEVPTLVINDDPRAKVLGPQQDGKRPVNQPTSVPQSQRDPNVYYVESTKDLNWEDPKTWHYENKTTGAANK